MCKLSLRGFTTPPGINTERNLLDILDKIHELSLEQVDETHMFTLSQVYEGLVQKMGEKRKK